MDVKTTNAAAPIGIPVPVPTPTPSQYYHPPHRSQPQYVHPQQQQQQPYPQYSHYYQPQQEPPQPQPNYNLYHQSQPQPQPQSRTSLHRQQPEPENEYRLPYDPSNRLTTLRRLCALQHPSGYWPYSPELAALLKHWGNRVVMSPAHGVTALAHATLSDLCHVIWAAQRDGNADRVLSAEEMESLEGVGWDISWAGRAGERAGGWFGLR